MAFGCTDDYSYMIDPDSMLLKAGVFGGSISVRKESEAAKDVWRLNLRIKVSSCGAEGAGFGTMTNRNVPSQIDAAEPFDIYILWASTNDAVKGFLGNVNQFDERTQDGGIQKSIELIRRKNPQALILFFTSLPRFDNEMFSFRLPYFVDDQIELCNKYNIPYLDQYHLCGFNAENYKPYYLPDKIHLSREGYQKIAAMQMEFIREQIIRYYSTIKYDDPNETI